MSGSLTEIAKYQMDTLGYCRLPNLINQSDIDSISKTLDTLQANQYSIDKTDVCLGQKREDGTAFISNIADASTQLREIAFHPRILEILNLVMNGEFKLNHSNAIISNAGATYPHMAGYPIHNKAFYHTRGDSILSSLTKLVLPISNNEPEDGGFAAIRGSHKSNYPIPYPKRSEEEWNLLEHIKINIGDAILFTEAMTHGSLENKSGRKRRMIFYCYSMKDIPYWSTQGLKITERFISKVKKENQIYCI